MSTPQKSCPHCGEIMRIEILKPVPMGEYADKDNQTDTIRYRCMMCGTMVVNDKETL